MIYQKENWLFNSEHLEGLRAVFIFIFERWGTGGQRWSVSYFCGSQSLFHAKLTIGHSLLTFPPYWKAQSKIWLLLDGQIVHQTQVNHQSFKNIFPQNTQMDNYMFSSQRTRCCCLVAQSCLTVLRPHGCTPPHSSVHGIVQARILEWTAISYSRGFSLPRNRTHVSPVSCTAGRFFTAEPLGNPKRTGGNKENRCTVSKLQWPS